MAQRNVHRMQWALLGLAAAAVAFLAWRNDAAVFENKGRLAITVEDDEAVLTWTSAIDVPMARRIEEAYDSLRDEVNVFRVVLHSPGGSILEGRDVINLLSAMGKTHDVITVVPSGAECASMCVPIFLAGEERIAGRQAAFMFHEPSLRDLLSGQKERRPRFEEKRTTDKFVQRYFEASPMDPAWREALVKNWQGQDIWKSGADLVAENSGVVTVLIE
ncbi:MAG: ATP-dependent Clp protease proteolytic subunit [Pseudomonadota bacterium]